MNLALKGLGHMTATSWLSFAVESKVRTQARNCEVNVFICVFFCRIQAFIYILYLITLSIALLGAVHSTDPTKYPTKTDKFRAFCEIFTLSLTVVYLFTEMDQMEK